MNVIKAPALLINVCYIAATGLALLFAPAFMVDLFEVPATPDYLTRMLGVLDLTLTSILAHCLLVGERRLLVGFGLVQAGTGVGYALCIVFDQAPTNLLVVVEGNVVLGLWTCLAAAGMVTLPADGPGHQSHPLRLLPTWASLSFLTLLAAITLVRPDLLRDLLDIPHGVPVYIGRIFGLLVLAFALLGLFALRAGNGWLLRRMGWIQFMGGLAVAAIVVSYQLPSRYWPPLLVNCLLGLWVARATLPPTAPRAD